MFYIFLGILSVVIIGVFVYTLFNGLLWNIPQDKDK